MLLAIDFDEDFVDVQSIAIASVFSLQPSCVQSSEFDTPKADRLAANGDASLRQQIFSISVAQIKAIVEPDSVGNDVRWKSVTLIGIHGQILHMTRS